MDEVAEHARAWLRRLLRQGLDDDDPAVEWLREVIEDPEGVLGALGLDGGGVADIALLAWLETVAGRPLPAYHFVDEMPELEDGEGDKDDEPLVARLRAIGVPAGEIDAALAKLKAKAETTVEEVTNGTEESRPVKTRRRACCLPGRCRCARWSAAGSGSSPSTSPSR